MLQRWLAPRLGGGVRVHIAGGIKTTFAGDLILYQGCTPSLRPQISTHMHFRRGAWPNNGSESTG